MSDNPVQALSQQDAVPRLTGWITLPEAAKLLGFSRQYCYRLAQNEKFKSLHRIGESSTFVVSEAEVAEIRG